MSISALMASVGMLLLAGQLSAADIEGILHFGASEPVSAFKDPQPPNAVTSLSSAAAFSQFFWGTGTPAQSFMMFSGPGGTLTPQGFLIAADNGKPFWLGRLIYAQGITAGGEAFAVNLDIVVTVTKPVVIAQPTSLTVPLGIVAFREDVGGQSFALGGQIIFPSTFPSAEFESDGAMYTLKLIGFGSLDNGRVATVGSLDLPNGGEVVGAIDLYAVVEGCGISSSTPSGWPIKEVVGNFGTCNSSNNGPRAANWGQFGAKEVLEFDSGETLEITCSGGNESAFRMYYTAPGASKPLRVGVCAFDGGCNDVVFYHAGDQNHNCKPDRLLTSRWISKDYGGNDENPNPWTGERDGFEKKLDWAETLFDATTGKVTKSDYKWDYDPAFGTTIPYEYCAGVAIHPEAGTPIITTVLDPPLGPETEAFFDAVQARLAQVPVSGVPMAEDKQKDCDFNGDRRCDAADVQIFQKSFGTCRGGAGYHPQADADGSGCVDARDRFYLFGTLPVVEFYHAVFDHYFISADPTEIGLLDAGTQIKGWARTSLSFNAYGPLRAGASPVCRFYIPPALGDSHFFGRGSDECASTAQHHPEFDYESPEVIDVILPTGGSCPANTAPIYRVFSNRADANHRYTTSRSVRDEMVAKGWLAEGDGPDRVVMCAPQ
jgi:hypothetical protein